MLAWPPEDTLLIHLFNSFEVAVGREDEFFDLWRVVNAYMVRKPGYHSHCLYRSITPHEGPRFVGTIVWESERHLHEAEDDGYRKLIADPQWDAFPSQPVTYDCIHKGGLSD